MRARGIRGRARRVIFLVLSDNAVIACFPSDLTQSSSERKGDKLVVGGASSRDPLVCWRVAHMCSRTLIIGLIDITIVRQVVRREHERLYRVSLLLRSRTRGWYSLLQ